MAKENEIMQAAKQVCEEKNIPIDSSVLGFVVFGWFIRG